MKKTIPSITVDNNYVSIFGEETFSLNEYGEMWLTDQQHCENFRIRHSDAPYISDWHVAGDPTLIIVLSGEMIIELRNGETRIFNAGQLFIAKDYLPKNIEMNDSCGHRAKIEHQVFEAIHIKLQKLNL